MKQILTLLFVLSMAFYSFAQDGGIIKGVVVDKSNAPVPFANVLVEGTGVGVSTDIDGKYLISGLDPGLYDVTFSFLGYETVTKTEVQVTNSKPAILDVEMFDASQSILGDSLTVVVEASPFQKTEESPVSLQTIGTAEIQRNPGGNRDISRAIRVLPGVTTTASFRNDLLIRGGSPSENRFYLDDVEVPNINHFATQGASGGPNGLINVDFIREVDFYSGAFPANRGNTLSSVFNFKQKNGRDDRLGFTATLGSSDLALTMEGPLSKKTTFLLSARQSYLQFLFEAIGLPFLPTYNDFQFKVRTKFNDKHELYFVGLGAIDRFKLNLNANETPEQRFLLDNLPINNQWNYTVGAVYKTFSENGYWTFVLSRNMLNNVSFKYLDNDENNDKILDYESQEIENKLRIENTVRFSGFKLNYGVGYEFAKYTVDSRAFALINGVATFLEYDSKLLMNKYNAFGQLSKKLFNDRLVLSAGLRLDGNDYSKEMANAFLQTSPRFSASFAITENFTINANTGLYYQLPAYTSLGFRVNDSLVNREGLKYIRSWHVVGGLEYNFKTKTKVGIEGYYKSYDNYPFLTEEGISLANLGGDFGVIGNAPVTSTSKGRSYGLEFLVQQRLFKGFYGIASYTLGWVEFEEEDGSYAPSSWESRHIVNVAMGKTFITANRKMREMRDEKRIAKGKEVIKRKIANEELSLGFNFRFQTGLPYTPFDYEASALTVNWDAFGRGIRDFTLLNTERSNNFYAIDARIDYKWYFPKWSFNLFFDIQNLPGIASGLPDLILDQGVDGNDPVQVVNQGLPNESYVLREIVAGQGVSTPSIGIVVQY